MVNRSIVKLFLASCMLLTSLLAVSQTETQPLSAFVDRNDISLNELLTLTIRIDSSLGNARPSLAGLNRDFEQIGNVSTRSSYTNINGTVQSFVDYIVQLRASLCRHPDDPLVQNRWRSLQPNYHLCW